VRSVFRSCCAATRAKRIECGQYTVNLPLKKHSQVLVSMRLGSMLKDYLIERREEMNTSLMDIKCAERLLDIYIQNICNIIGSYFDVNHAENTMFDAIILLKDYSGLKLFFLKKIADTFLLRVRDNFDCSTIPTEFVELCAHELRWPEFLELARKRAETFFHDVITLVAGDVSSSIREAYSDEWMDRIFYRRYCVVPSKRPISEDDES